jgi:hypothetical protein
MKFRRHHNNKAYRSNKNGKRSEEIKRIAKKLGIKNKESGLSLLETVKEEFIIITQEKL